MESKLTSDFWEAYDKATERIKQDKEWQDLEFKSDTVNRLKVMQFNL